MSGRYSAHPDYQNSGLDWLGRIPKSWELRRLGSYFRERRTKVSDAEFSALSVTMQGIVPQLETAAKTNDGDNRKLVRAGDFVINSRSDRKGSSGVSPYDGSVSLISIVLEPLGIRPPFAHHLLRSSAFQEEFYRFGKGIVADLWSTNYAAMKNIMIPMMPLEEQCQIAKFLDYETAKIDALIEKQQQLIALLKEKRQAVISHAVTKGLNPDVAMRDSGVEWLGEVPKHWEVTKLKWKAGTTSGGTPSTSRFEMYYEGGDIPWIRTTDLNNGVMLDTPISITPRAVRDTACSVLPVNSVLLAMYGGAGSIGKHALLKFESTINQAVAGILPSRSFDPGFLHGFYEFYRPFWMIGAAGTRKDPNIGQDHIKESELPCPPLEEQVAISEHLDRARFQFDELSKRADEFVELLQERRIALISAAVTGKIDVRDWKSPEPEAEVA